MSPNHSTPRPTPTPLCFINGPRLALLALGKLDEHEAAEVRAHLDGCAYCQVQVRQYEIVREAVARHFSSDTLAPRERTTPGSRRSAAAVSAPPPLTVEDVMQASDNPRAPVATDDSPRPPSSVRQYTPRQRPLTALGAIAAVLVLAVLAASLFSSLGGRSPARPATPTASPTDTATPMPSAPSAPLVVSDAPVAQAISFAFVANNDVWVSLHGAPPQQVTHLGLGAQPLSWFLLWSPDQTKLFVDPSNPASGAAVSEAWIISLPGNTVQTLPASAPVIASCADHDCAWLEDRYLVHQNVSRGTPHSSYFRVYDTQAQRDLSTGLDDQQATRMQVRGASVYFTPYALAPISMPGTITRFDFSSNQITTQFTVPGPLVDEGIPSGSWNLSADGREVVERFSVGISSHCPLPACYTFYQDMRGVIAAIFPSYQSHTGSGPALFDEPSIAPDGKDTASLMSGPVNGYQANGYQVVQQALPSGTELLTALPAGSAGQAYQIMGWIAQPPGILVQQLPTGAGVPPLTTRIYFVPLGEPGAAQLVETIGAGQVICAPPTA